MSTLERLSLPNESNLPVVDILNIPAPIQEPLGRVALTRIASVFVGRKTRDFPETTDYIELHVQNVPSV